MDSGTIHGISLGKLQAEVAEEFSEGEMLLALDVKPILANKCFSCHGDDPEEIEGGLDMTSLEGLLQGGESFDDVLIPDAEFSFMMEAIRWEDPDYEMPPKENDRLTEEQIWSIRNWIREGLLGPMTNGWLLSATNMPKELSAN